MTKKFRERLMRELNYPSFFGCFTGDCPHDTQVECDTAIETYIIDCINELDEIRSKPV